MISAMMSKTQQIHDALAADDPIGTLRIAGRFFDRSDDTMILRRGMDAYNHPGFYRQLGQEPDQIITPHAENPGAKIWIRYALS